MLKGMMFARRKMEIVRGKEQKEEEVAATWS